MSFLQCKEDDTVMLLKFANLPDDVEIFVEKSILEDLVDPVILDVAESEKVDLLFIPPLPRPLSEYKFYNNGDTPLFPLEDDPTS